MSIVLYQQVNDGQGNISFVPVPPGSQADGSGNMASAPGMLNPAAAAPANSVAALAKGAVVATRQYVSDRAGEQSTLVGAVGGAALAPTIAHNVASALASVAMGDYVGAAVSGVPALIGIVGSLAAIFTPDKVKGLSDADIQNVVNGLSRQQLVGVLGQSDAASVSSGVGGGPGIGSGVSAAAAVGHYPGSFGLADPVPTAIKTV